MDETSAIAPKKGGYGCGHSSCTCGDPKEGFYNEALELDQVDVTCNNEPEVKRVVIAKATDIFCEGARFDGIAKPVVPPPPPGVAPNAIQKMYAESNTEFVILEQNKKS